MATKKIDPKEVSNPKKYSFMYNRFLAALLCCPALLLFFADPRIMLEDHDLMITYLSKIKGK